LFLLIAYLVMPGLMMGAHYADMRIAPFAVAMGVLALSPTGGRRAAAAFAIAGLVFLGARLVGQSWTYVQLHDFHQAQLRALDHVPPGARVFAKANLGCSWSSRRVDHLGSMVIVRRHGFANGQWPMPGGHLMSIRYAPAGGFALDETQFYKPEQCRNDELMGIEPVLARFPREAFDYVWLLDVEPSEWPREDWLRPVWRSDRSILYRIVH
jgi:hypothetical protein